MDKIRIEIESKLTNVAVVRVAVATFVANYNVKLDELVDIKTAVSEAVTNSIVHGYEEKKGTIVVECIYSKGIFVVKVIDKGIGIGDISLATTPAYTSKPELEHAGMGFTIMSTFMDDLIVDSSEQGGTIVTMTKKIDNNNK
ncbi:MAG: anti-sigma F factor [Clostridia bacterium]